MNSIRSIVISIYACVLSPNLVAGSYAADSIGDVSGQTTLEAKKSLSDPDIKRLDDIRDYGYMHSLERKTLCDSFLAEINYVDRYAKKHNLRMKDNPTGFVPLNAYDAKRHLMALVDTQIIRTGSRNYISTDKSHVTRIYTKTDFGPLMVLHMRDGPFFLYPPEFAIERFEIVGEMADVFIEKHTKKKWSTTIVVSVGKSFYRIESGLKLEGEELQKFMGFVKDLIENG